jgi:hypothetical protein
MKTKEQIKDSLKNLVNDISNRNYQSSKSNLENILNAKKELVLKKCFESHQDSYKRCNNVTNEDTKENSKIIESQVANVAIFRDKTKIELDNQDIPIGYKLFQKVDPGNNVYKKPPASFGEPYMISKPRRGQEGYEIIAYPKVKKYEMLYTA